MQTKTISPSTSKFGLVQLDTSTTRKIKAAIEATRDSTHKPASLSTSQIEQLFRQFGVAAEITPCPRRLKIVFIVVGPVESGSNMMRVFLSVKPLQQRHHDVKLFSYAGFLRFRPISTTFDRCILVRYWSGEHRSQEMMNGELSDHCHSLGGQFVWDPLDAPLSINADLLSALKPDLVFTGSPSHAAKLREECKDLPSVKFAVWPHAHTNPGIQRTQLLTLQTLGYTASPNNELLIRDLLKDFATRNRLTYAGNIMKEEGNPADLLDAAIAFMFAYREISFEETSHQARQLKIHNDAAHIDLAVIWPGLSTQSQPPFHERPITRLLFWMSHGVPVVTFNSTNYLDLLKIIGLDTILSANTEAQLQERLNAITNNPVLARTVSELSLQVASYFTVEQTVAGLERILCKMELN